MDIRRMMKRGVLIISILMNLALLTTSLALFLNSNNLKSQCGQSKNMLQRMQEEIGRLQADKEKMAKDSEKLQADAVSYVALNTKLQEEKDKLQKSMDETRKIMEAKEGELKRVEQRLADLEKKGSAQQGKLLIEKDAWKKKAVFLGKTLQKERGLYHYNLGVVYSQAKLYDEAIEEYEKSLKFNLSNPEAYYNLGLLYENFKGDLKMAGEHYRKYLELKPDAADKEEVQAWIERLKGQPLSS